MQFEGSSWTGVLIWLGVGTVTTSHRTTSTYPAGSSKERRFRLESWPVLLRASLRENHTTASPKPRIPSPFLLTGSPSRAQGTAALLSIPPPGLLRRARAFTLLNTGITWQKRFASTPTPPPSASSPTGTSKLTYPTPRVKSTLTKPTADTTSRRTRLEKRGTTHSSE